MILLSRDDLGRELGIGPSGVLRWLRDGLLPPPLELDGYVRWARPQIERWASEGCLPCTPPDGKTMLRYRKSILREIKENEAREQLIRNMME